jgi:alkanesulfonate monooxygenase SsuD/methylene tetrahydromethanopterin reductase-like flavin-dependent oxidoreductase (luciferase family)
LPIVLANISQPPANFAAQIAEYRERFAAAGHDPKTRRVAVATHCYVAPDSQAARDEFYPYYRAYFSSHAARPYFSRDVPRDVFETRAAPHGPIFVGSPQEIIDKLSYERELFGHDRFLAQIDIGGLPYERVARSVELLAGKVRPALRD